MAESLLMKGNEALAEAAIRAGCRFYFGYPITPQNEISEYMARRLKDEGGVFVRPKAKYRLSTWSTALQERAEGFSSPHRVPE